VAQIDNPFWNVLEDNAAKLIAFDVDEQETIHSRLFICDDEEKKCH
jgi:hypothetical protein